LRWWQRCDLRGAREDRRCPQRIAAKEIKTPVVTTLLQLLLAAKLVTALGAQSVGRRFPGRSVQCRLNLS